MFARARVGFRAIIRLVRLPLANKGFDDAHMCSGREELFICSSRADCSREDPQVENNKPLNGMMQEMIA